MKMCNNFGAMPGLHYPELNVYGSPTLNNNVNMDYSTQLPYFPQSYSTHKDLVFNTGTSDYERDAWKTKIVKDWSCTDVLRWIAHISRNYKFDYMQVKSEICRMDGASLAALSADQFKIYDQQHGQHLYDALQQEIRRSTEILGYQPSGTYNEDYDSSSTPPTLISAFNTLANNPTDYPTGMPYNDMFNSLTNNHYGSGDNAAFVDSSHDEEPPYQFPKTEAYTPSTSDQESSDIEKRPEDEKKVKKVKTQAPGKRPPGRPPGVKTKKDKPEKKTGRLWEFIRDLLLDPQYCPSVICWENHSDGVFRFVKSEKVAKIWGTRKGNEKMTYEKLSRAMRYYYRSKVLQPVLGRRLVYKFGPTAKGWRTDNPNFTNKGT